MRLSRETHLPSQPGGKEKDNRTSMDSPCLSMQRTLMAWDTQNQVPGRQGFPGIWGDTSLQSQNENAGLRRTSAGQALTWRKASREETGFLIAGSVSSLEDRTVKTTIVRNTIKHGFSTTMCCHWLIHLLAFCHRKASGRFLSLSSLEPQGKVTQEVTPPAVQTVPPSLAAKSRCWHAARPPNLQTLLNSFKKGKAVLRLHASTRSWQSHVNEALLSMAAGSLWRSRASTWAGPQPPSAASWPPPDPLCRPLARRARFHKAHSETPLIYSQHSFSYMILLRKLFLC